MPCPASIDVQSDLSFDEVKELSPPPSQGIQQVQALERKDVNSEGHHVIDSGEELQVKMDNSLSGNNGLSHVGSTKDEDDHHQLEDKDIIGECSTSDGDNCQMEDEVDQSHANPSVLENFLYKSHSIMTSPVKTKLKRVKESKSHSDSTFQRSLSHCLNSPLKSKGRLSPSSGGNDSSIIEKVIGFNLQMITARLKSLNCGLTTKESVDSATEESGSPIKGKSTSVGGQMGRERSRFRARIEPSSNITAEEELRREIK